MRAEVKCEEETEAVLGPAACGFQCLRLRAGKGLPSEGLVGVCFFLFKKIFIYLLMTVLAQ